MLCKHEVVGSIPSASTRNGLRFGTEKNNFHKTECVHDERQYGLLSINVRIQLRIELDEFGCGIYDIVKRKSIRTGSWGASLRIAV